MACRSLLLTAISSRLWIPIWASKNSFAVRCSTKSDSIGTMTTAAEQKNEVDDPVVSAEWLHANLRVSDVKILDASWYMPHEKRNPLQEFQTSRIPGASYFDIDAISDKNTDLPHMLPSKEVFAAAVSSLGIQNDDRVVVYDGKGIFSAPRVWWMFRVFGHRKVWVLDGGMPLWRACGYDIESSDSVDAILKSTAASDAAEKVHKGILVGPTAFEAKLQHHLLWNLEQIHRNIEEKSFQHVDARAKGRFDGVAPEPRQGIRSGHIPGSKCVPFPEVLADSQTLLPSADLARRFKAEGIDLDRPIVASCGTGVTACILALGLFRLGRGDVPVYDGSWTEWVLTPGVPVRPL
ncbi:thiosulfate/3-mercaptopyruvate sulfurtransferase 1, mitochondrial-like isoform X2 [Wolffia australiana]